MIRIRYSKQGTKMEDAAPLRVLYLKSEEKIMLHQENKADPSRPFIYCLEKSVPVFTNSRPDDCSLGKRFVLPFPDYQIALVLGETIP